MENNRSTRVNINVTLGYSRAVNGRIVVLCISRVPEFIEFLPLVCLLFLNKSSLGVNKELYSGGEKNACPVYAEIAVISCTTRITTTEIVAL